MTITRSEILALALAVAAPLLSVACGGGTGDEAAPAAARDEAPAATPRPAAAPAGTPGPRGDGKITGTVRYEGEAPPMREIKMDADPGCAKKHSSPAMSEMLVLGEGNTVGNVFVRIKSGLPGGSYAPPSAAVTLDQEGCQYKPHVVGLMVGQPLEILNSDGLLHNVHALPKVNKTFNMAMPASRTAAEVTFDKAEEMFKIKCDVHPWMGAYVAVVAHPFFDVTGADGLFSIADLPAGSYEVEVWHERLGTRSQRVEVAEGQAATIDFTLTR